MTNTNTITHITHITLRSQKPEPRGRFMAATGVRVGTRYRDSRGQYYIVTLTGQLRRCDAAGVITPRHRKA